MTDREYTWVPLMPPIFRHLGIFLLYGSLGALLMAVTVAVLYLVNRDDLSIWHQAHLEEEYEPDGGVETFQDYLILEEKLFAELEDKVIAEVTPGPANMLNRYARNSFSSPDRWADNWNRSFELTHEAPVAGALLLHGMSDSPYSMRALAERLHAEGLHVVGLRYPGHGTVPGSLTRTSWEDMYGAVELAARYLQASLDGSPFYIFGYSTGGPLAVELSLRALEDESLPLADGLVLFSPAMGITPLATLAPWQARLGRLLGFEKMAWNSIEPEYDPFKYRSFPLNAAVQVWRLAEHVNVGLGAASAEKRLADFPAVLSFQSVVDTTIDAAAVRRVLFERLPAASAARAQEHELVAYDFNRSTEIEPLLSADPWPILTAVLADRSRQYDFTLVTNSTEESRSVLSRTGGRDGIRDNGLEVVCSLHGRWPGGVYSLTHIALPFPPDDPLYGGEAPEYPDRITLGNVVLRGESGSLRLPAAGFLRQTYNPFFDDQFERVAGFIGLRPGPSCPPHPG